MALRRTTVSLDKGSAFTLSEDMLEEMLRTGAWREWCTGDLTSAVVNSGVVTDVTGLEHVETGVTASSTASLRTSNANTGFSVGQARTVIDFGDRILIAIQFTVDAGTTTGLLRVTIGKATGIGVAELAVKGIGIRIANVTIGGHHYGTGAVNTAFDTGGLLVAAREYRVVVVSSNGRMEWFMDIGDGSGMVSRATATTGPTGLGTAGNCVMQIEAANGADAVDTELSVHYLKTLVLPQ